MAARSKKTTYKNKGKKKQSKQNPLAKDILLLGIVVFGILCLLSDPCMYSQISSFCHQIRFRLFSRTKCFIIWTVWSVSIYFPSLHGSSLWIIHRKP